jgi:hypothetical protein
MGSEPMQLLEAFERVKRYDQPRQCPDHPNAKIIMQMLCGEYCWG